MGIKKMVEDNIQRDQVSGKHLLPVYQGLYHTGGALSLLRFTLVTPICKLHYEHPHLKHIAHIELTWTFSDLASQMVERVENGRRPRLREHENLATSANLINLR